MSDTPKFRVHFAFFSGDTQVTMSKECHANTPEQARNQVVAFVQAQGGIELYVSKIKRVRT